MSCIDILFLGTFYSCISIDLDAQIVLVGLINTLVFIIVTVVALFHEFLVHEISVITNKILNSSYYLIERS